MFVKSNKTEQIQIRCTKEEKEMIRLMSSNSPQQDISTWIFYLIKQEYDRVSEFDVEVKDLGEKFSTPNFKY